MFDIPPVEQLDCLAQAIYHEARSESFKGMLMVGFVIKARRQDSRWEDTYCGVIEEPWQFSFIHQIGYAPMRESDARAMAEDVAWIVATSDSPFPDCMLYYHEESIRPNWDWSKLDFYDHEDAHVFYVDAGCTDERFYASKDFS